MKLATVGTDVSNRLDVTPTSQGDSPNRWEFAFQISLLCAIIASCWHMLGLESQTIFENNLRLVVVYSSWFFLMALWIASSHGSSLIKYNLIAASLFAISFAGVESAREFDASCRVLVPARLDQGRIVHEALGVSYARLPQSQIQLQPLISRSLTPETNHRKLPPRLRFGELAVLCRMVMLPREQDAGHRPPSIILEIQPDTGAGRNIFARDVRQIEARFSTWPNTRIREPAHESQIAGFDSIEFEFVDSISHLRSRQVFLRTGGFVLNFMLNSERDEGHVLFDEFLKSIQVTRVETPSSVDWARMIRWPN